MNENTPIMPVPINPADQQRDALLEDRTDRVFGSYRIIHRIGAGGMGEVYLAHDNKLDRNVALKILSPKLTGNHEHLLRFKQEARAASALNHPYILTIYEFGVSEDGVHFIASEYVEGKTLNRWAADPDLDLTKKLDVLVRVASALSAAHEAGIVHRDVKPENIIVRPDGYVKVVDFGLVKLLDKFNAADSDSTVETSPHIKTGSGVVMGTASYMSPEQAKGRKIDQRSDIFSFGVVLYELVTGTLPFTGDSAMEIIACILHKEPKAIHDDSVSSEIKRIIEKSLKKDPDERYQSMVDLIVDLKDVRREIEFHQKLEKISHQFPGENDTQMHRLPHSTTPEGERALTQTFASRKLFYIPTALVALILLAGTAFWIGSRGVFRAGVPAANSQGSVQKITNWANAAGELSSTASFSGDGRFVAFGSTESGATSIWVKQANKGDSIRLTKDEFYNRYPIWSPEGDEVAYYSNRGDKGGLWRVAQMGGEQKLIAENVPAESKPKFWSKTGRLYFQGGSELFSADPATTAVSKITDFASLNIKPRILDISRDESRVAYLTVDQERWSISVFDLKTGMRNPVVETSEQIENFVWHPDGSRILFSRKAGEFYQIFSVDIGDDAPVQLTSSDSDSFIEDVSRDGSQILFSSVTETSDLWRVSLSDSKESLIASQIDAELWADVSLYDQSVVYQSIRNLRQGSNLFKGAIMVRSAEENARPVQIAEQGFLPRWSPDGKTIAFLKRVGANVEVWTTGRGGDQVKKIFENGTLVSSYRITPYLLNETAILEWSPDGSKLAFTANREGISNIWLFGADGANAVPVSQNTQPDRSFSCPIWSPDGNEIAFVSNLRQKDAAEISKPAFIIYQPETGSSREIAVDEERLRFLGWSENRDELIYLGAKREREFSLAPPESSLRAVSLKTGESRTLKTFEEIYFDNAHLSPDRRSLAFTSRKNGNDDIWIWRIGEKDARVITQNKDPRLYFSTLTWSPDSGAIYFGKQSRFTLLSMFSTDSKTEKQNE